MIINKVDLDLFKMVIDFDSNHDEALKPLAILVEIISKNLGQIVKYQDFQLRLEQQLTQLRDEITLSLSSAAEGTSAAGLKQLSNDELIDYSINVEQQSLTKKIKALKRVDAALCQLELELYGICSDCEELIERTRLEQDPTTHRCQSCSEKHALKSKGKACFAL